MVKLVAKPSSNIEDLRKNPRQQEAISLANQMQETIDNLVIAKNTASTRNGAKYRRAEKQITYKLDSYGTQGKGRLGGGQPYRNRLDAAIERSKWRD